MIKRTHKQISLDSAPHGSSSCRIQPLEKVRFNDGVSESKPAIEIAERTGPLRQLVGRRVLLVADIENLVYSAKNLQGKRINHAALLNKLLAASSKFAAHAVFCTYSDGLAKYLTHAGYQIHRRHLPPQYLQDETTLNSDNRVSFTVGWMTARLAPEVVVVGTGDGDLGCSIAEDLKHFFHSQPPVVLTLSLAGSTSQRLCADRNRNIDGNIEVGNDCLR
ncbi:MAG: hypothetical protein KDA92_21730 [Planctomycetales bacterium]|nr:hypothetical protein [Planctomycetales bacterium]MCA9172305.1 hypothetical protein [Planctomycetales bacterium]